jgi:putative transposase
MRFGLVDRQLELLHELSHLGHRLFGCPEGRRFELPSQFAHLKHPRLRYARWDLSNVDLVDARTGAVLCALYPVDKTANASGERRLKNSSATTAPPPRDEVAPLLSKLMAEFAATGLPPPYLPDEEEPSS